MNPHCIFQQYHDDACNFYGGIPLHVPVGTTVHPLSLRNLCDFSPSPSPALLLLNDILLPHPAPKEEEKEKIRLCCSRCLLCQNQMAQCSVYERVLWFLRELRSEHRRCGSFVFFPAHSQAVQLSSSHLSTFDNRWPPPGFSSMRLDGASPAPACQG